MSIRVLIADDHAVVRDGLSLVLSQLDGFEVVGEAATGDEAVKQAAYGARQQQRFDQSERAEKG